MCVCVCVCGSGIPYVMGDRDGNIQNPCPCGDIFFCPTEETTLEIIQNEVF